MKMSVLYLGPPDTYDYVQSLLPETFEVRWSLDDSVVSELIQDCDIVLDAYMKIHFSADRLQSAHKLKLFVTATTGADHIDSTILEKIGVPLLTLKGQREALRDITAAAEHSWLLLMACARLLRGALTEVLQGEWERNKFPGVMLRGKTLGIIGCGRIGQWMATYACAFGMNCLGYDPYIELWPNNIIKSQLDELLNKSDFITVHVPLSNETRGLLGSEAFEKMQQGVMLINTSRGEIIDESAFLSGLQTGRVGAAGIDVLAGEPHISNHPLVAYARQHNNLIITPHIAGFSPDALRQVLSFSCRRIIEFFEAGDGRKN